MSSMATIIDISKQMLALFSCPIVTFLCVLGEKGDFIKVLASALQAAGEKSYAALTSNKNPSYLLCTIMQQEHIT